MSDLCVGLMSGTSLDGIDAALVRIDEEKSVHLEAFQTIEYSNDLRIRLLEAMGVTDRLHVVELDVELGELFAGAVSSLLEQSSTSIEDLSFVASHGQTIWHSPGKESLQIGSASVLAGRLGVPVVSDFRTADIEAGGQGAPLVPMRGSSTGFLPSPLIPGITSWFPIV